MNWKLKALAQAAISCAPFAPRINYAAQRLITNRFGDIGRSVADRFNKAEWFARAFRQHGNVPLSAAAFLEFGAGWHLAVPLSLWCLGVERQITLDVSRLARLELVNKSIAALRDLPVDMPRRPRAAVRNFRELEARYGITYRAPYDARRTGYPDAAVDCVTSTLTLQHIPVAALEAILRECRRILRPSGLFAAFIDYADNYAYTDRSISIYNFLKYPAWQWRWFNSRLHYQNRLRHPQYRRLIAAAGLSIVDETLKPATNRDLETIRRMKPAPEFAGMTEEELAIRGSSIAARPAGKHYPANPHEDLLARRA